MTSRTLIAMVVCAGAASAMALTIQSEEFQSSRPASGSFQDRFDAPPADAPFEFGPREGRRDSQRGDRGRRGGPEMRERLLEQFDADEDGVLSDAERDAARAAFEARKAEHIARMIEKFDADGDGALNAEELAQAEQAKQRFERAKDRKGQRGKRGHDRLRGELRERFDANEDGQLDEAEREAARAFMEEKKAERKAQFIEQWDADGDGQISEAEKQAAKDARRAQMEERKAQIVAEFDADGDGELTGDERRAAHQAMRARHSLRRALDPNRDGVTDQQELLDAVELIEQGDRRADFNADGVVDEADKKVLLEQAASGN